MPNAWENVDLIAAEALTHLEDSLVISSLAATDKTADFLSEPNGYKVGDTVRIKTRPEYEVNEFTHGGQTQTQSVRESSRSMTIEKLLDVSVEVGAKEKALDLESFSEQVIQPAAYALAEKCDQYLGTKLLNAAGAYYSSGLLATQGDMALARKAATLQQLEPNRFCLVDLDLETTLLGADYFATWEKRGDQGAAVINSGSMGGAMGMQFYSSINFPVDQHTPGNGAGSTKASPSDSQNVIGNKALVLESAATGTFNDGDRIMVAGVRRPLIVDGQQATPTTIALKDPITEIIPDGAAVTVIGSAAGDARGAIFDKRSVAFAMPMLDTPSDKPGFVAVSNGYSIRVVQGYDMKTKTEQLSMDLLIGAEAYDPRRITLLRDTA